MWPGPESRAQRPQHAPGEPPPPPPINFQGRVLEAGIREPIAGAIISVDGKKVTQTNSQGKFEIRGLPLGNHKIHIISTYHESFTVEEIIEEY